jgi:hypothetical protein
MAFVWAVWKARNDRVFNNVVVDVPVVFDLIQRLSWKWFVNNTAKVPFLLYEWVWNPVIACCGTVLRLLVHSSAVFYAASVVFFLLLFV